MQTLGVSINKIGWEFTLWTWCSSYCRRKKSKYTKIHKHCFCNNKWLYLL